MVSNNDIKLLVDTRVVLLEVWLVIALPVNLLFEWCRAQMIEAMLLFGGTLSIIDNEICVNGYTDPSPPGGGECSSNLRLSIERAVVLANALRSAGYMDDIIAFCYVDSRFSQLPNLPDTERQSLGRSVDLVVLPTAVRMSR